MIDSSVPGRDIGKGCAHKDTVLEVNATDLEGFKEQGDWLAIWLRIDGRSRRRVLVRCVERYTRCRIVVLAGHGEERILEE